MDNFELKVRISSKKWVFFQGEKSINFAKVNYENMIRTVSQLETQSKDLK